MELRENTRRISLFAAVRSDSIGDSDDEAPATPAKDAAPVRRFSVAASKVRRQISEGAGASERAIQRTTSTFIMEAKKKEDQWIQEERSRPGAGPRGSLAPERRRRGTGGSSQDDAADEAPPPPAEPTRRRSCALEAEEQIILADIAKRKTIIDSEESLCDKRLSEIFMVEETQLCTLKKAAQSANVPVIQVASSVDAVDDARKDKKVVYEKLLAFKDEMLLLNLKRERTTKAVLGKKLDELTQENDELRATLDGLWQHCEAQGVSKCSPVVPPAASPRVPHNKAQKARKTPPVRFLTDEKDASAPLLPALGGGAGRGGGALQSAVLKLRYAAEPCLAALRGGLAALRADVAAFQAAALEETAHALRKQQQGEEEEEGRPSSRSLRGGARPERTAECGVQAAPEVCCGEAQTEAAEQEEVEEEEEHVHPPSAEVLKAVEAGIRGATDASVRYVLREVPRRQRRQRRGAPPPPPRRGRGAAVEAEAEAEAEAKEVEEEGEASDVATLSDTDGRRDSSEGEAEEEVGAGSSSRSSESCAGDSDVDTEEDSYLSEDSAVESSSRSYGSCDSGESCVINAPCVCPAQVKVTVGGAGDVSEEGLRGLLGSYAERVTAVRLDALTQAEDACGSGEEAGAGTAEQKQHVHVLEVTDEEAAQQLVRHFAEAEGLMLNDMPVQIEEHAPATPLGGTAANQDGQQRQQSSQEQRQRRSTRRAEGGSGGADRRAGQRRSEATAKQRNRRASSDADGGASGAPAKRRNGRRSRDAGEARRTAGEADSEQRRAEARKQKRKRERDPAAPRADGDAAGGAAVYHTKSGARLNISPLPRSPTDEDCGAKEWSIDVVPDPERVRVRKKAKRAKEKAKVEAAAKKRVKLYAQQWCTQTPLVAQPPQPGPGPIDKYKVYCYRCGSGGHRNIARCPHCSSTIYYGVAIGSEKKEKLRDEVLREWRRWLQARDDYCARNAAVAQAHAGTRQLPASQGVVEPDFTGTIGGCFSASQGGRFFEQLLLDSHTLGDDACGDVAADAPLSCLLSTSGRAVSPRTLMQGGWVGSPTAEQPFAPHPPCAASAAAASSAPPLPRVANAAALAAAAAASPPETHMSQIVDAFAFSREVLKRGADAAAEVSAAPVAAAAVVPRRPSGNSTWPAASGRIHRRCGTGVPVSHEAGLGSGAKVNGKKTSGGGPHQHQQAAVEGVTGFAAHVTRARAKLPAGATAAASAAATATMPSTTTTEGGNGGATHHRSSLSGSAYMSAVVPLPLL